MSELEKIDKPSIKNEVTPIKVGSLFYTYEELKESIKHFQTVHRVQLCIHASRKSETANESVNTNLKYTHVSYRCIFSARRNKASVLENYPAISKCPFKILVGTTGDALVVNDICYVHSQHPDLVGAKSFVPIHQSKSESNERETTSLKKNIQNSISSKNMNENTELVNKTNNDYGPEYNNLINIDSNLTASNMNNDETENNFQEVDVSNEQNNFSSIMTENEVENNNSDSQHLCSDVSIKLPNWKKRYQIEKILGHGDTNGVREYFVKWKGYDLVSCTWEKKERIKGCQELIDQYEEEQEVPRKESKYKSSLMKHLSEIHLLSGDIEEYGRHQCPYCGQHFMSNEMLIEHMGFHSGRNPHFTKSSETYIYHCNYCKFSLLLKNKMIQHIQRSHLSIVNFEMKTRSLIRNKKIIESSDIIPSGNLRVAVNSLNRATLLKYGQEKFVHMFEEEMQFENVSMSNIRTGSTSLSIVTQNLGFSKSSMVLCSIPSKTTISNETKSTPKISTDELNLLGLSRREKKRMKIAQKLANNKTFNVIRKGYSREEKTNKNRNRYQEECVRLLILKQLFPEYKDNNAILKATIIKRAAEYCETLTQSHNLMLHEKQKLRYQLKKNRTRLVLMKKKNIFKKKIVI